VNQDVESGASAILEGAAPPNVIATLHFPPAGEPYAWPTSTPSSMEREKVQLLAHLFELEASLAHAAALAAAVYRDDGRWDSHLPGTAELLNRYFGPKTYHSTFPSLASGTAGFAQAVAELFGARITWVNRPTTQRI
jgi:hypothetical protein